MFATPYWASECNCQYSHYLASHRLWPCLTVHFCHCHLRGIGTPLLYSPVLTYLKYFKWNGYFLSFWTKHLLKYMISNISPPAPILVYMGIHIHSATECKKALCINMIIHLHPINLRAKWDKQQLTHTVATSAATQSSHSLNLSS